MLFLSGYGGESTNGVHLSCEWFILALFFFLGGREYVGVTPEI